MMKQKIIDFTVVLLLTFALGYGANWVTRLVFFQVAFPQLIALQDFHWEDFVFKLRPDEPRESRITLINISEGSRLDIARQIDLINSYNPKTIGVDVIFNCYVRDTINCPQMLDTLANNALSRAIKNSGKVVLATRLYKSVALNNSEFGYDSLELSDLEFSSFAKNGFANLVVASGDSLSAEQCRSFIPSIQIASEQINALSIQLAFAYDSLKTQRFLSRRNTLQILNEVEELINYRGNVGSYQYSIFGKVISKASYFDVLDYDDLSQGNFDKQLIQDRIILLAYLGEEYLEDPLFEYRFYTPLNSTVAGRSLPDMLGSVIHANIISMILNEDGINQLGEFWDFCVMLIVVSLNIILFIYLLNHTTLWYDSLGFLIPVTQIVIISWLRIELLASYNFRLDLENIIYLLAFVTFAVNIYFGPIKRLLSQLQSTAIETQTE